jgi:hypothetical protein
MSAARCIATKMKEFRKVIQALEHVMPAWKGKIAKEINKTDADGKFVNRATSSDKPIQSNLHGKMGGQIKAHARLPESFTGFGYGEMAFEQVDQKDPGTGKPVLDASGRPVKVWSIHLSDIAEGIGPYKSFEGYGTFGAEFQKRLNEAYNFIEAQDGLEKAGLQAGPAQRVTPPTGVPADQTIRMQVTVTVDEEGNIVA